MTAYRVSRNLPTAYSVASAAGVVVCEILSDGGVARKTWNVSPIGPGSYLCCWSSTSQCHSRRTQTPPQSGWLDELGRLKGGWSVGLGVARCALYCSSELPDCSIRRFLLADV